MIVYACSDIHGCLNALNVALARIEGALDRPDTKLVFLGDYIHGGEDSRGVVERIMSLQQQYGCDKVIALMGNHEQYVIEGKSTIDLLDGEGCANLPSDERYVQWFSTLPYYHQEGDTLFVHAGIDEEYAALGYWQYTDPKTFIEKFPPETGRIKNFGMKVVAGHVPTKNLSADAAYRDIYYDGGSHYYIDGAVKATGYLNLLMVDVEAQRYYRVTDTGPWPIFPYDEER